MIKMLQFLVGITIGAFMGVVVMCALQINNINKREGIGIDEKND